MTTSATEEEFREDIMSPKHVVLQMQTRVLRFLNPSSLTTVSTPLCFPKMSVEGKATGATAVAVPTRWLNPKLLAAVLLLALLLILTMDASVLTAGFSPPSLHLNSYLGPISAVSPTIHKKTSSTITIPSPPPKPAQTPLTRSWISVSMPPNLTSTLLSRWLTPGGSPCRDSRTAAISIPSLDGVNPLELPAGEIHEFFISALDDSGRPRCLGGDYFETDLSGESWKSRPPVTDHGNGSYSFKVQIHPHFSGEYTLTIVLLFRSFEGLKFSPERFKFRREMRRIPIKFYQSNVSLPDLQICRSPDFTRELWSGRWTQHGKNNRCAIDNDGRFRCLDHNFKCQRPWCDGPLGLLESNGWVYSAHCFFRVFTQDLAWKCLSNKWLFFWGDSNHVDTIRNLLNFVLGLTEIPSVPRRFDTNFTNPKNRSESVRITSIFNGHWNETKNYLGLHSLQNEYFRQLLWKYFSEDRVPDAMIFNSGLHDGVYWRSIRAFSEGAEYAAQFWQDVLMHLRKKQGKSGMPRVFYRSTIATGGYARDLAFNPNKMEAFNGVLLEKLKEKSVVLSGGVIDEFDMSYPWHYDNRCNDGVHYGRAPAKARWRDGEIGHQYFVDLMLAHVLLNAVCNG